jgi:nucleoside-diphosphate-sugar epimerase
MAFVLVTGSAGAVGRAVCSELLRRGHVVRGFDRDPTPGVSEAIVGDVAEAGPVREAVQGVDTVIHLAAEPNDADFSVLLGPNVVGLFNVMNASRQASVRRVVLASSVQVLAWNPNRTGAARVDEAEPGNHYGLTKLWAEQMGEMYARCYAMSVLAVRLAWVVRNADEARKMQRLRRPDLYFSSRDAGRLFALAVEAERIGFEVVYGASIEATELFDLEPARRVLGYEPQDRWPDGLGFEPPAEARE